MSVHATTFADVLVLGGVGLAALLVFGYFSWRDDRDWWLRVPWPFRVPTAIGVFVGAVGGLVLANVADRFP